MQCDGGGGAANRQMMHASKHYGYTVGETSFDWGKLKEMRDAYVKRLNGIYHRNVEKSGVTLVYGVRAGQTFCGITVAHDVMTDGDGDDDGL